LRAATTFTLDSETVSANLMADSSTDAQFERAWQEGLDALLPNERRGALLGVMGHIAESVVESILTGHGYATVWHFAGPGRHGVDLLMLSPTDQVAAIEVKSTLRASFVPRLTVRELTQMSAAWLEKADNPGMTEWGLDADDVYGMVVVVNFADRTISYALTIDFERLHPITALSELNDLQCTSTAWTAIGSTVESSADAQ
jgi:hypothetical protein